MARTPEAQLGMQVLEGTCFVTEFGAGAGAVLGTLRCRPLIGRHNGAVEISMRALEFARGESPWLHAGDWDDVWYVLEGRGELWLDEERHAIRPDTGIHVAAGRSARVVHDAREPVRVVSVRCPDPGTDPHVASGREPPKSPRRRRAGARSQRGSAASSRTQAAATPSPLVHLTERAAETTADRWYRVLVDPRSGCEHVTQFVGSIPPGRAPDHFHEYEEVLCILDGHGRMWAGETHAAIAAGSCIYLPRRQVHCVENRGPGALRLLGVFYPAGSPAERRDDSSA